MCYWLFSPQFSRARTRAPCGPASVRSGVFHSSEDACAEAQWKAAERRASLFRHRSASFSLAAARDGQGSTGDVLRFFFPQEKFVKIPPQARSPNNRPPPPPPPKPQTAWGGPCRASQLGGCLPHSLFIHSPYESSLRCFPTALGRAKTFPGSHSQASLLCIWPIRS